MFISVLLKYTSIKSDNKNVAILDTEDGSIEVLPYEYVRQSGVHVENMSFTGNHVSTEALCVVLQDEGSISFDGTCFRYFGHEFCIDDNYDIIYKGKAIGVRQTEFIYYLAYIFKFKEYIVMRFKKTGSNWFTVALSIKDGTVTRWEYDTESHMTNFVFGDKSVATRIDTISEV